MLYMENNNKKFVIWKNFLKRIFLFVLCNFLLVSLFPILMPIVESADLMEYAFEEAMANDYVINLWNNKNSVWQEIFEEWMDVTFWDNNGEFDRWDLVPTTMQRPPLIVRIAKFLLRITVALSITMIIYNWIRWIIEASKWSDKVKEASTNLIYVAVGLFVALLSVTIINLISSLSISTFSNPEQFLTHSVKDEFERFCDWVKNDIENADNNLTFWTQEQLQVFCLNPRQPILWTQNQMQDFLNWWRNDPWQWTLEQVDIITNWVIENPGTWTLEKLKELDNFIFG